MKSKMQISVSGDKKIEFAKLAMAHFSKNPQITTFTEDGVDYDCLFAVRWGLGDNCALVFTIGDEPIIYTP